MGSRGWLRAIALSLLSFVFIPCSVYAHTDSTHAAKPAIYQGTTLKLDLGSTAVVLGASRGKIQHYEMAINWRLKNKWYPTFEAGYAGGTRLQGDSINYSGQGGFFRVGLDINPLKKHPESPHALLIGLRLGTAVQQYSQDLTRAIGVGSKATGILSDADFRAQTMGMHADCWGEIVGGCQVEIAKDKRTHVYGGFYMGWMARFRCLFTRADSADSLETLKAPIYIPGFGPRDNIAWGLSYHIGYRF